MLAIALASLLFVGTSFFEPPASLISTIISLLKPSSAFLKVSSRFLDGNTNPQHILDEFTEAMQIERIKQRNNTIRNAQVVNDLFVKIKTNEKDPISLYILETSALTSAFGSSNTSVTSGSFDNSTGGSSTFGFNKSSMNLREVIQNLRVKMKTKDNPVNNEKFETKVKEVEKVLNKGQIVHHPMPLDLLAYLPLRFHSYFYLSYRYIF
jgi:activator of HSP90 ATPase